MDCKQIVRPSECGYACANEAKLEGVKVLVGALSNTNGRKRVLSDMEASRDIVKICSIFLWEVLSKENRKLFTSS